MNNGIVGMFFPLVCLSNGKFDVFIFAAGLHSVLLLEFSPRQGKVFVNMMARG